MTTMPAIRESRPYKFLDAYTRDDSAIFFGRERETRVLVTDIVVNRLVVLFARTGTGKTSLIHAGARPRLESQGYETFFIRVNEDPVASARAVLLEHPSIGALAPGRLAEQLEAIVEKLGRPIVLFFDQFEEFFIYVQRPNPKKAREFIEDVTRLYRNPDSGVHLVFSMREEFFVEMDVFRDDIPTIFHNDSNLRLRRFDAQEAYAAIVQPARVFDVRLDPDLVEQMLADLAAAADAGGEIEPAQLQIVCDALWDKVHDGRLTLADYRSLGREGSKENIAQQVLYRRLEDAFQTIESRPKLELLERLLGALRTDRGTKWVRDVESLTQVLTSGVPEVTGEDLRELLRLLERVRFIRRGTRDTLEVVELSHDYLVERIDELQRRVRLIWPRRLVERAEITGRGVALTRTELDTILAYADQLELSEEKLGALFAMSLVRAAQPERWFTLAEMAGLDAWGVLADGIDASDVEFELFIDFIERLLLDDRYAADRERLLSLLDRAVERDETSIAAQTALVRLSTRSAYLDSALEQRIMSIAEARLLNGRVAPGVIGWMARNKPSTEIVKFLLDGLDRPELTFDAQSALLRLVGSDDLAIRDAARETLLEWLGEMLPYDPSQISREAIRSLGRIEHPLVLDVLSKAMRVESLAIDAKTALERMAASEDEHYASSARSILSTGFIDGIVPTPAALPTEEEQVARQHSAPSRDLQRIAGLIHRRQCAVIIGAGVHAPNPVKYGVAYAYNERRLLTSELTLRLAERTNFESSSSTTSVPDFRRVCQHAEALLGRRGLERLMTELLADAEGPSPLLMLLAKMPFSVWLTTNYDTMIERALISTNQATPFVFRQPFNELRFAIARDLAAAVVKLHGDLEESSSLIMTEDDFIEFILNTEGMNVRSLRSYLQETALLLLGWNYRSLENRLILRSLIPEETAYPIFAVDPAPDPLLRQWEEKRAITVIEDDLWSFVPALHDAVMKGT